MSAKRPDFTHIFARLKDFQRATVDHAFRRLYLDKDRTRRFLVADEVGLGKTMVARGVMARVIEHLWDTVDRINIVYVCSSSDIARQNVRRLAAVIPGYDPDTKPLERITLLPLHMGELTGSRVNLVSFTPGTSFNLRSSLGQAQERILLYVLLDQLWGVPGTGPMNLLQGYVTNRDEWRKQVRDAVDQRARVHEGIKQHFFAALNEHIERQRRNGEVDLYTRFVDLCRRFRYYRTSIPEQDRRDRDELIGELRSILARTCLEFLKPDLVILDEFQRFKELLAGEGDAGELAQELFHYADEQSGARVLLLSATPYKMYTLAQEKSEDHYEDFIWTVSRLYEDDEETQRLKHALERYRGALYRLAGDTDGALTELSELRAEVESRLSRIMVRTERLAASEDRDGMLREVAMDRLQLAEDDVRSYLAVQRVARSLEQGDMLAYWKSAPYMLSFMDDYQVKRRLRRELAASNGRTSALVEALDEALEQGVDVDWDGWRRYEPIDPSNARLRRLIADTVEEGMWRMLWLPPSQPYYKPSGPFADADAISCTKRLVFSAWRVVPKVIAAMLSYEAERHMIRRLERDPENTPEARRQKRPLLRFGYSEGRLTGMPVLALMYPSIVLCRLGDPLRLAGEAVRQHGELPTQKQLKENLRQTLEPLLAQLPPGKPTPIPDEAWYWAAPLLLDFFLEPEATRRWLSRSDAATRWSGGRDGREGEVSTYWPDHVARALELVEGKVRLGSRPPELASVLVEMALAGPGVVALRSLARGAGLTEVLEPQAMSQTGAGNLQVEIDRTKMLDELRYRAGQVAFGLRTLFNTPEAMALIRGYYGEEPYWRRVLEYCVDGCLQAVMDEYIHVLVDSLGVAEDKRLDAVAELSRVVTDVVSLRTASMRADEFVWDGNEGTYKLVDHGVRGHFALRFGEERSDDGERMRPMLVRDAFNSPFRPFVLATTSVGQEGLDFHLFCHAVVHWDLPSNPVDLEQREGRVHRYKGHAIRKNVARLYGKQAMVAVARSGRASHADSSVAPDVWQEMFALAVQERGESTDLVPYWIFPVEGGASIERHVPLLPLSRDVERLEALKRSLTVYRMVFGQARQEDLVAFLLRHVPEDKLHDVLQELTLDLRPPETIDGRWGS